MSRAVRTWAHVLDDAMVAAWAAVERRFPNELECAPVEALAEAEAWWDAANDSTDEEVPF